jgi:hypothetical protein
MRTTTIRTRSATTELKLLYLSIRNDGYTMPIVTIRDEERDRYVIVDGFHRYTIMKRYPDIYEKNHGLLPIVVIDRGKARSLNEASCR